MEYLSVWRRIEPLETDEKGRYVSFEARRRAMAERKKAIYGVSDVSEQKHPTQSKGNPPFRDSGSGFSKTKAEGSYSGAGVRPTEQKTAVRPKTGRERDEK